MPFPLLNGLIVICISKKEWSERYPGLINNYGLCTLAVNFKQFNGNFPFEFQPGLLYYGREQYF